MKQNFKQSPEKETQYDMHKKFLENYKKTANPFNEKRNFNIALPKSISTATFSSKQEFKSIRKIDVLLGENEESLIIPIKDDFASDKLFFVTNAGDAFLYSIMSDKLKKWISISKGYEMPPDTNTIYGKDFKDYKQFDEFCNTFLIQGYDCDNNDFWKDFDELCEYNSAPYLNLYYMQMFVRMAYDKGSKEAEEFINRANIEDKDFFLSFEEELDCDEYDNLIVLFKEIFKDYRFNNGDIARARIKDYTRHLHTLTDTIIELIKLGLEGYIKDSSLMGDCNADEVCMPFVNELIEEGFYVEQLWGVSLNDKIIDGDQFDKYHICNYFKLIDKERNIVLAERYLVHDDSEEITCISSYIFSLGNEQFTPYAYIKAEKKAKVTQADYSLPADGVSSLIINYLQVAYYFGFKIAEESEMIE